MDERVRPGDRFQVLLGWYSVLWVVFGPVPNIIAALDDPGALRYWALALPAALALCFAVLKIFPRNPVVRPSAFLGALLAGLGAIAYLRSGGAALYIVSLPHFWILARSPRRSIILTVAGGAATLIGAAIRHADLTGNAVFTVIGCAGGVLLGLGAHWFAEQSEERAARLSAELEATRSRLAEAHRRQGASDERERLAREIHDTLAQGFASIIVLAEAARAGLDTDPGKSAKQLRSIEQTARENFTEARVLVGSVPQSGVAPASIARTLRRTLDRFAEDTGIAVSADLPDVDCDRPTRIALLRCAQESLANVRKHAGAAAVGVVLERHPHGVELEITDDGRGFAVGESRGFGLDGMRRRLAELGGELTVTSSIGDGTRVLAMIPMNGQVAT
ncbi:sensor histidine kinase [Actinomadura rubrisoli]|uniref:histidine kinase n=1 Tax=Actinomadura rubrisoli TaxID=2530368 RepID=A0A4R5BVA9_9ACTN|nr:sensor histidine kinase [Actinomadura rubrisoli]TDD88192.1 sensor histidine kinase [Actinomadura rubrisoli]